MIRETITKLEERLKTSASMPESNRQELLDLLTTLKAEVSELSKTHAAEAEKIVSYTQASTQEVLGPQVSQDRLELRLRELSQSVDGFEKSHPQLVDLVNRIALTLSNLGI